VSDPSVRFADEVVRRPERAAPVELVDTIESPVGPDFTKDEALRITAKIGGFAAATWRLLGIARQRSAHRALGYRTFADYMAVEFDLKRSQGYRLLAHADLVLEIEAAAGLPPESPMGDFSERALRDTDHDALVEDVASATAGLDPADLEARAETAAAVVAEHVEAAKTSPPPVDSGTVASAGDPEGGEHHPVAAVTTTTTETVHVDTVTGELVPPPPDPAPASSPLAGAGSPPKVKPVDLAPPHLVYRERASKAVVKATELLRLDPAEIVRCMDPDERSSYVSLAADTGRFGRELAAALDKPNIRRVK